MEQTGWLSHWHTAAAVAGALGSIAASMRFFPRFWRGFARALASPVLLEIQRETTLAREQQVAELLEIIEASRKEREAERDRPPLDD